MIPTMTRTTRGLIRKVARATMARSIVRTTRGLSRRVARGTMTTKMTKSQGIGDPTGRTGNQMHDQVFLRFLEYSGIYVLVLSCYQGKVSFHSFCLRFSLFVCLGESDKLSWEASSRNAGQDLDAARIASQPLVLLHATSA